MSWRTVVISRRAKLDLKLGYMVVRDREETVRVYLDEIAVLIIENTAVSLTAALLAALNEKKVKVIFCDSKRDPYGELMPYYGSHDTASKVRLQVKWTDAAKADVWAKIVYEKINKQQEYLEELGKNAESHLLKNYLSEILPNDASNREGHAAKVYFNALFGLDFTRTQDRVINAALNYGYSIILSAFSRECTSNGYITQLGIFHNNMFNQFNLACDLMEPFRILVDRRVKNGNYTKFEKEERYDLVNVLNRQVYINGTNQYISNAIKLYCKSVFAALNENEPSLVKEYKNI